MERIVGSYKYACCYMTKQALDASNAKQSW